MELLVSLGYCSGNVPPQNSCMHSGIHLSLIEKSMFGINIHPSLHLFGADTGGVWRCHTITVGRGLWSINCWSSTVHIWCCVDSCPCSQCNTRYVCVCVCACTCHNMYLPCTCMGTLYTPTYLLTTIIQHLLPPPITSTLHTFHDFHSPHVSQPSFSTSSTLHSWVRTFWLYVWASGTLPEHHQHYLPKCSGNAV